ncbi:SOS response-associated peptidase [Rhodococcus opacus]|uniref:SOS response-associated peptidase n=1 Tax=Rhodococcus opacus TaxID=37919 RepID=UPI001FF264EC|nr:SOS response-associated peptidase [Rhodococcus opacus]UOT05744.1 SOS response-associated peptidase [Rhodococcus opacus]
MQRIHPAETDILPLAGIFDFWRNPDVPDEDPDAWLVTYSVITTEATDDAVSGDFMNTMMRRALEHASSGDEEWTE